MRASERTSQMIIKCCVSLFTFSFPRCSRLTRFVCPFVSECAPVNWYNCSRTTYYRFISHIHYVPDRVCTTKYKAKMDTNEKKTERTNKERRKKNRRKNIIVIIIPVELMMPEARGIFDTEQNGFVIVLEMWTYFKFIIDVMVPCRYCWWFKPFFKSHSDSLFFPFGFGIDSFSLRVVISIVVRARPRVHVFLDWIISIIENETEFCDFLLLLQFFILVISNLYSSSACVAFHIRLTKPIVMMNSRH